MAALAFTQPVSGTVWTTGQDAVIQWDAGGVPASPPAILTIDLLYGPPAALTSLGHLAACPAAAGTVTVNVPAALVSGTEYCLRGTTTVTGPAQFYSDPFTVRNPDA
jgi:hypothetical protein